MSDILQYKMLCSKIKEALNEKVIGDVHVECEFDPYVFGTGIMIVIDAPSNKDSRWYHRGTLDEFTIKNSFDDEEKTSKLILEIVNNVLDNYKEYVYKRYFFDY